MNGANSDEHVRLSHHDPSGGFRNPWLSEAERPSGLRWMFQRMTEGVAPNPEAWEYPRAEPGLHRKLVPEDADTPGAPDRVESAGRVQPSSDRGIIQATWIGHATFLLRIGGYHVLTDPHWGQRASPVSWAGPTRLTEPGLPFEALPPIDAVVLSHDHYDHLDRCTIEQLARRFGDDIRWFAPLGHGPLLRKWGARQIQEMDWYETETLGGERAPGSGSVGVGGNGSAGTDLDVTFLPSQHWTARTPFRRNDRLWGSWSISVGSPGVDPAGRSSVYFGGDSGWFPGYSEIGEHAGPFDLVLLPIGAYEPRWFMRMAHMNPEEAVRAYVEMGGEGLFCGMHWGTFRLTDEHPLEPPVRVREAWRDMGLPEERLWVPALGETRSVGR